MVVAVMAMDLFADRALGTDAQLAWCAQLKKVDAALANNDVSAAELAWRETYAAALKSRHWEGMVAVGDAYRQVGDAGGFHHAARAEARQSYLTALFRARGEGSVDGVLRVAERFAELGDRDVVEQCIRVAWTVAAQAKDPLAQRRAALGRGLRPARRSLDRRAVHASRRVYRRAQRRWRRRGSRTHSRHAAGGAVPGRRARSGVAGDERRLAAWAAAGGLGERVFFLLLGLGRSHGDPAPRLHAFLVEDALDRALGEVATEFLRRVSLVDLHPLALIRPTARGDDRQPENAQRHISQHLRRIVPQFPGATSQGAAAPPVGGRKST